MSIQNQNQELDQSALDNLESIESEIETSSNYFKPKPSKTYVLRIDPQNKIVPIENDRFKDANGKPIKRYAAHLVSGIYAIFYLTHNQSHRRGQPTPAGGFPIVINPAFNFSFNNSLNISSRATTPISFLLSSSFTTGTKTISF